MQGMHVALQYNRKAVVMRSNFQAATFVDKLVF
jgi:hypothetical protein